MDMLLFKARMEMICVRDEGTNGRSHNSSLAFKGRLDEPIAHLRLHRERNLDDANSWYKLGDFFGKAGDAEE